MPYTIRNKDGILKGLTRNPVGDNAEFMEYTDSEYVNLLQTRQDESDIEDAIRLQIRLMAIRQMKVDSKIANDFKEPTINDVSSKQMGTD